MNKYVEKSNWPITYLYATMLTVLFIVTFSFADVDESDSIYESPTRSVNITINAHQSIGKIPEHFLGINTSYFNDTDDIWNQFDIPSKIKYAGIGAMRFPGGEETSFYHWQHPGVNGYEDIWDNPDLFGYPKGRGPFQVTWVDPDEWETNKSFLDFDGFMANCIEMGIEPVVGINMSSARNHNRIEDGIQEALDWLRYCEEKGYEVTYWYLDNEPWHQNANYTFDIVKEYGPDVLRYGEAIKNEFPEVKLIVNPLPWGNTRDIEYMKQFLSVAGPVIDYIDLHYYWAWGLGSWEYWKASTPLTDRDKWTKAEGHQSIGEICDAIRLACKELGLEDVGLMFLEWNIGPDEKISVLSESALALIHAQYLIELIESDIEIACLWPLLWRSERAVWPEQDRFPSIITQVEPYELTATAEAFAFISKLPGGQRVELENDRDDVISIAVLDASGDFIHLLLLSKSSERQRVVIQLVNVELGLASADSLDLLNRRPYPAAINNLQDQDSSIELFVAPYSFSHVQIPINAGD